MRSRAAGLFSCFLAKNLANFPSLWYTDFATQFHIFLMHGYTGIYVSFYPCTRRNCVATMTGYSMRAFHHWNALILPSFSAPPIRHGEGSRATFPPEGGRLYLVMSSVVETSLPHLNAEISRRRRPRRFAAGALLEMTGGGEGRDDAIVPSLPLLGEVARRAEGVLGNPSVAQGQRDSSPERGAERAGQRQPCHLPPEGGRLYLVMSSLSRHLYRFSCPRFLDGGARGYFPRSPCSK